MNIDLLKIIATMDLLNLKTICLVDKNEKNEKDNTSTKDNSNKEVILIRGKAWKRT